jgi:predicted ATPase/Tfp pilus assembly protein PilF
MRVYGVVSSIEVNDLDLAQRYCPMCGHESVEEICPNDGAPTVLLEQERPLSDESLIGKVFSKRYQIESLLGEGGMGRIYIANQITMNRKVALKVIRPDQKMREGHIERFYQEARLASQLSSPHVVRMFDFGIEDTFGHPFMAMELLEGENLADYVIQNGLLGLKKTVMIASQVCRALVEAAQYNMVHRDLKPENIFLVNTAHGEALVKVMDFGIAKIGGKGGHRITQTGMTVGTPSYMSPEQIHGHEVDSRSDLYSLGCMIFEMVTGELPFDKNDGMAMLMAHLQDAPRQMMSLVPPGTNIPDELLSLVDNLLKKKPVDRPDNPSDVLAVLARLQEEVIPSSASFVMPVYAAAKTSLASEPSRTSSNLQRIATDFIGREDDLRSLLMKLRDGQQLITLTGPGGMGKTRLANETGHRASPEYIREGGVWLCDLSACRSLESIVETVAHTLEVPLKDPTIEQSVQRMGDAIAARGRILIILDNFEQIMDYAIPTIGVWMSAAPEAQFLVTSQARLMIPGENAHDLAPLSVKEGVRLFVERAQSVRATFEMAVDLEQVTEEIVKRLDGIPLAIELAAARVGILKPKQILNRLEERFKLLKTRGGHVDRQKTLQSVIDWSWDLLSPAEQATLCQCSVFERGFFLEAAEEVVDLSPFDDAPMVMDCVQVLVDRSLLRTREIQELDDEPRFGMYESIRIYAQKKLETSGVSAVEVRHASYFLELGNELRLGVYKHGGLERQVRLEIEEDNILSIYKRFKRIDPSRALQALNTLEPIIRERGPFAPFIDLMKPFMHEDLIPSDVHGIRLCRTLGWLYRSTGQIQFAWDTLAMGLSIARHTGIRELEALLLCDQAILYWFRGEPEKVSDIMYEALKLAQQTGSGIVQALVWTNVANIENEAGDFVRAESSFQTAIRLARSEGNDFALAANLNNVGCMYTHMERWQEAEESLSEARGYDLYRTGSAIVWGNLGALYCSWGKLEAAEEAYEQALKVLRRIGERISRVTFLCYLSLLRTHRNDLDNGEHSLEEARVAFQNQQDPRGRCFLSLAEAGVRLAGARLTEVAVVQGKLLKQAEQAIRVAESKGTDGSAAATERWSDARLMHKLLRLDLQRSAEISAVNRKPDS